MATLEEIRQKLLSQEEKKSPKNFQQDNAVYPFWTMEEGETAIVRFLPDGNENNDFFWEERLIIKLPFKGIKGVTDKKVIVNVPCIEMYGKTCPIISEIRPWWKDNDLVNLARTYYKKKSYIFQGFVVKSPFEEEGEGTGRYDLRRFIIGSQLFDIIKASLMDPDMEELPTDFTHGVDFKISKTSSGQYSSYTTSNWSRKTRPLEEGELETVKAGLWNLRDFLPKEPTEEEIEVITEMFRASVEDEEYDPAKWGQYYRPTGFSADELGLTSTSSSTTSAQSKESEAVAEEADEADDGSTEKVDALAKLRARAAKASDSDEDDEPKKESKSTESESKSSSSMDVDSLLASIRARANKQNG